MERRFLPCPQLQAVRLLGQVHTGLIVPENTERVSSRFGVCYFQDDGLQQIALFDKERAVIDKTRPHNKTGKWDRCRNGFGTGFINRHRL
jgi:hypothetical protein